MTDDTDSGERTDGRTATGTTGDLTRRAGGGRGTIPEHRRTADPTTGEENTTADPTRRLVLRATAGLTVASGLAGCLSIGGGSPAGNGDGDGDGSGDGGEKAGDTTTTTTTGTPVDCGTQELKGRITEDITLPRGCSYTLVGGNSAVVAVTEGATLTVEPGVTVEVEGGDRLKIEDEAALAARGTEDDPIVFRGTNREPGHWDGIWIYTDSPDNELRHVRVSHGGHATFNPTNLGVGVSEEGSARATIRNCEFTHSAAAGLWTRDPATLDGFENNRFADNAGPPMVVHASHLRSLGGTSTFENNGEEYVSVRWNSVDLAVTEDATWSDPGIPYRFGPGHEWLVLDGAVEVEPGTRVEFTSEQGIKVKEGSLTATGTSEDPIEFVGVEDTPGHWNGIQVFSDDPANEFADVVLSDGGATTFQRANLALLTGEDAAPVTVRDSEITDSSGWGIFLESGSLNASNNTFGNNAEGDVRRP